MNATKVNAAPTLIEFSSIGDPSLGYITVGEANRNVPFEIKRVYWTYFTPHNVIRGGHAHKELQQLIFAVAGRIEFTTETLTGIKDSFVLDNPNKGLYFPPLVWRDIQFSHNAVLMCLCSDHYEEDDYFRDYSEFKSFINHEK